MPFSPIRRIRLYKGSYFFSIVVCDEYRWFNADGIVEAVVDVLHIIHVVVATVSQVC